MLDYQAPTLDRVFHALSDPTRRRIVERLSDGPASVSELAMPFSISLAAVVQHVQALEASGLVRTHKAGRVRTCRVEPRALSTVQAWFDDRRAAVERQLDALGAYLEQHPDPPQKRSTKR